MALLEVEDLHTYYGNIHALKGISLTVDEGEIVTLIGANGAGKTTTLNTISGLLRPRERRGHARRQDLADVPSHEIVALGVVQVPEGRRVFARLTVEREPPDGRLHASRTRPTSRRRHRARATRMFPRLKERSQQVAGTLSGGEQQMLAMGRALMARTRACCCWTSRRWAWRRTSWSTSSRPSATIHAAGHDRSCWSSRTRSRRWPSPTAATCSRRAGSSSPTPPSALAANEDVRRAYLGEI